VPHCRERAGLVLLHFRAASREEPALGREHHDHDLRATVGRGRVCEFDGAPVLGHGKQHLTKYETHTAHTDERSARNDEKSALIDENLLPLPMKDLPLTIKELPLPMKYMPLPIKDQPLPMKDLP
jgi:hypothetical protein